MASARSRSDRLYARLNPGEREIRLLHVEPSHDSNAPIRLQMTSHSMSGEKLHYKALSYTWGNPSPDSIRRNPWIAHRIPPFDYTDRMIYVNNFELIVTANLFFCLRQFRKGVTRQSPLWVDAICLNQEDKAEVADQVRMMGDIYSNCIEVLVWLGDEEGETDSEMAVKLVNAIYNLFEEFIENGENNDAAVTFSGLEEQITIIEDAMEFTENTFEKFWHDLVRLQTMFLRQIDLFSLSTRCDRRAWAAVGNLTKRSWFRRLWTFQEKSIGKLATLMIGDNSVSWAIFHAVMSLVNLHDNMGGRRQAMLDNEPVRYFQSMMPIRSTNPYCLTLQHALLDVVRCARSRECSDPRDKVFGVLSTASKTDAGYAHFLPLVNYETSTAQGVYTELARFYIEDQNDLTVLSSCTSYPASMKNLPTWAPDWTTIQFESSLQHHVYCAANESQPRARYYLARNEMHISGIVVDYCRILAPLAHPYIYPGTEVTTEDIQRVVNLFRNLYEHGCGLSSQEELEGNWIDLSKSIDWEAPYRREQTGQTCAEAYWRTLFVDVDPRGFKKSLTESFTKPLDFRIPNEVSVRDLIDIWFKLKPLPETFEPDVESMETRRARFCHLLEPRLLTVTQGRHFYVTENGYMGLATHNAEPGDLVVVLLGSNIPFLLRRVEEHYTVIGETYIHGFMDGESMDPTTTGGLVVEFNLQ